LPTRPIIRVSNMATYTRVVFAADADYRVKSTTAYVNGVANGAPVTAQGDLLVENASYKVLSYGNTTPYTGYAYVEIEFEATTYDVVESRWLRPDETEGYIFVKDGTAGYEVWLASSNPNEFTLEIKGATGWAKADSNPPDSTIKIEGGSATEKVTVTVDGSALSASGGARLLDVTLTGGAVKPVYFYRHTLVHFAGNYVGEGGAVVNADTSLHSANATDVNWTTYNWTATLAGSRVSTTTGTNPERIHAWYHGDIGDQSYAFAVKNVLGKTAKVYQMTTNAGVGTNATPNLQNAVPLTMTPGTGDASGWSVYVFEGSARKFGIHQIVVNYEDDPPECTCTDDSCVCDCIADCDDECPECPDTPAVPVWQLENFTGVTFTAANDQYFANNRGIQRMDAAGSGWSIVGSNLVFTATATYKGIAIMTGTEAGGNTHYWDNTNGFVPVAGKTYRIVVSASNDGGKLRIVPNHARAANHNAPTTTGSLTIAPQEFTAEWEQSSGATGGNLLIDNGDGTNGFTLHSIKIYDISPPPTECDCDELCDVGTCDGNCLECDGDDCADICICVPCPGHCECNRFCEVGNCGGCLDDCDEECADDCVCVPCEGHPSIEDSLLEEVDAIDDPDVLKSAVSDFISDNYAGDVDAFLAAMEADDSDILNLITELEEKLQELLGANAIEIDSNVALALSWAEGVTMAGAAFSAGASDTTLTLTIAVPSEAPEVDDVVTIGEETFATGNIVPLEITLVGDEDGLVTGPLAFPIAITMPIPANIRNPDSFYILHYKDGIAFAPEYIKPINNGDGTCTFFVTSFSVFAYVEVDVIVIADNDYGVTVGAEENAGPGFKKRKVTIVGTELTGAYFVYQAKSVNGAAVATSISDVREVGSGISQTHWIYYGAGTTELTVWVTDGMPAFISGESGPEIYAAWPEV
jgi:hypothetical protein